MTPGIAWVVGVLVGAVLWRVQAHYARKWLERRSDD